MSLDSMLSLLLGIPIGLISGLYTGLIVTRYARFAELRNEALRIIRSIDFMREESRINITNDQDLPKFVLIASDLLFLGHKKAGEQVTALSAEITNTNYAARAGRINIDEYSERYARWQDVARALPGSKRILWSVWGRL